MKMGKPMDRIDTYIKGQWHTTLHFDRMLTENEKIYHNNTCNKMIAESRPLYRLKKWFIGLRPVNNWLWRRGCEVKKQCRDPYECIELAGCLRNDCPTPKLMRAYINGVNSPVFPDYPSIRELSTERPANA